MPKISVFQGKFIGEEIVLEQYQDVLVRNDYFLSKKKMSLSGKKDDSYYEPALDLLVKPRKVCRASICNKHNILAERLLKYTLVISGEIFHSYNKFTSK